MEQTKAASGWHSLSNQSCFPLCIFQKSTKAEQKQLPSLHFSEKHKSWADDRWWWNIKMSWRSSVLSDCTDKSCSDRKFSWTIGPPKAGTFSFLFNLSIASVQYLNTIFRFSVKVDIQRGGFRYIWIVMHSVAWSTVNNAGCTEPFPSPTPTGQI